MRPQGRTVARELARIAGGQHGVVTRRQLLAAGLSAGEIARRVHTGALLREHRDVYRVGHRAPSVEARYLACGDGAVLSGLAAAHLLGLGGGAPPVPEVTTATERRVAGVVTRRARARDAPDAATWRGIPVTTVARTLVDLAAVLAAPDLARARYEAGVRHGTTPAHVEAVLARRPTSPGAANLREILRGEVRVTLSALERRFLGRLREGGAAASADQPAGRRPARGLPLARPPPHRRARRLPLPQLPPRLGAGPAPRARGPRPRRRVPPLHVGRRLRVSPPDAPELRSILGSGR